MRKIYALCLIVFSFFEFGFSAFSDVLILNSGGLSVRQSIDAKSKFVDYAYAAYSYPVLDVVVSHYHVLLPTGEKGWIYAKPSQKWVTLKSENSSFLTTNIAINVRESVNLSSKIVTTVPKNMKLEIKDTYIGYFKVQLPNKKEGWVYAGTPTKRLAQFTNTTNEKKLTKKKLFWKRVKDVAQYKGAGKGSKWGNELLRKRDISLTEAFDIANDNKDITFFFYMKNGAMYLEGNASYKAKGQFIKGDAVFFSGNPWYGSAPGYSDAYEKVFVDI